MSILIHSPRIADLTGALRAILSSRDGMPQVLGAVADRQSRRARIDTSSSRVILLNGPSSAGKTTLGRAVQLALGSPFFYWSSDQLVDADVLPSVDRTAKTGEWSWRTIRPRFFDGFHRGAAAIADAGNDMIIEHVIEFRSWYVDLVTLLRHHSVFFVGVHCEISELERRERLRGDRKIGEGRSHLEDGVHTWGRYDIDVDTTRCSECEARDRVVEGFRRHDPARSAFRSAWLDLERGGSASSRSANRP